MLSTLLGMMLCTTIYKGFDIKPVDVWAYNDAIKCADIIMDLDEEASPEGDDNEENTDESEDDVVQIKEIIKFINKSALPIETQNVESETSDEGNGSGNNYYLVDNDYSQINERLDQIDNKLSSLSLLGVTYNNIYLDCTVLYSTRIQWKNSHIEIQRPYSSNDSLSFLISEGRTYYFDISCSSSSCDFGFFTNTNTYSKNILEYPYRTYFNGRLSFSFTPSEDLYFCIGMRDSFLPNDNLSISIYYQEESEQPPVVPDDPDEPVDPDEPIIPDSNILDALNSIKAEIAKNNRFNNYEIYTDTEAFEASDMYLNKYQYETFKLLRYLVILAVCQIGALMLILFSWRSRNGNT